MSNYVKAVNFAAKDALITGDPNKKAKGTEVDTEFNAIATMSGTKEDSTNKGAINGYAALDVNQIVQGAGLNATGTVIPANGVYLPAANTLGFATATTQRMTINATGNFVHLAPTAGINLTLNALAGTGNFGLNIVAADTLNAAQVISGLASGVSTLQFNTAGAQTGLLGMAGATSQLITGSSAGDMCFRAASGGFQFSTNLGSFPAMTITAAGRVAMGQPTSGVLLTLNAATGVGNFPLSLVTIGTSDVGLLMSTVAGGQSAIQFNAGGSIIGFIGTVGTAAQIVAGSIAGDMVFRITAGGFRFTTNGGFNTPLAISSAGNVTIAAPTSGTALALNSSAGTSALTLATSVARGGGSLNTLWNDPTGIKAQLGFSGGNDDFYVSNELAGQVILRTSGVSRINITAVGQTTIYDPLNAINALKNAATYETGSFTGTLTGCTTSPTGTINWSRVGNTVTLEVQSITATSNTTTCTITGVPANLVPVRGQINFALISNSGTSAAGVAAIAGTVISLYPGAIAAAFTASGTKGSIAGFNLTYNLT